MSETSVIVCCGVGGAGKTTTAAALAVSHALAGKRAAVLTIDPAKRLADALGVQLGNDPTSIPLEGVADSTGTLAALMLDREATWRQVIERYASSPEQAQRLMANPYYDAVATRLTGSHEYMAIEKLHQLVTSGDWDVVVLDTPPAQHVLEFFEAPERVRTLLDRGALARLIRPGNGLMGAAARSARAMVEKIAGSSTMGDITDFFDAMSDLSEDFGRHSDQIVELLASERTRYLLVTDANHPERSDVLGFLAELRNRGMTFAGFLVNRTAPTAQITDPPTEADLNRPPGMDAATWDLWARALVAIVPLARQRARQHRKDARKLAAAAGGAPVWHLPDVPGGIQDLRGLAALAPFLPPRPPTP